MSYPDALAIMCKAPVPGRVKTRLVPALSEVEAAGLYGCFIDDIIENMKGVEGVDKYVPYTPSNARVVVAARVGIGTGLFAQDGETLGDKIYNVFRTLFDKGYKRVVVIGSDSPDLPARVIEGALSALDGCVDNRVVLGPAHDGGYYLIAMSALHRTLFADIPWSTPEVLERTVLRASESGIEVSLLEPFHDIDTPEDLARLKDNAQAPKSAEYLSSLGKDPF